jgi:hypothetical protein
MHPVFVDELLIPYDLDKNGALSFEEFKKGFYWNIILLYYSLAEFALRHYTT